MNLKRKTITLLTICLLLFSTFTIINRNYTTTAQPSGAELTGNTADSGKDTDGDSKYNSLEVAVEINVSVAGNYRIEASGLGDQYGGWLYIFTDAESYLDEGLRWLNLSFYGPAIHSAHFDPKNISWIELYDYYYYFLDEITDVELSRIYNYTQFDPPFKDMEIEFTVYPDAAVGLNGNFSHTHIYPQESGVPLFNATTSLSTSGDTTTGSIEGTVIPPEYERSEWPLNSSTAEFLAEYYNDMLSAKFNATLFMPPAASTISPFNLSSSDFELTVTYSNGLASVVLSGVAEVSPEFATIFPFNVTDLTVFADYTDNEIEGNITFHTLAGFPLSNVVVDFSGNETGFSFTGHINVVYGNYSDIGEINETTLEQMLADINNTIPGRGDDSLYNMTDGAIECTSLNTTKTALGSYGARVDYNATLSGNFTDFLAKTVMEMFFTGADDETYPMICAALNATLSSVQNASLELNYYYSSKIAVINMSLESDVKELWSNALQLVPPTIPEEYRTQYEAWLKIANGTAYALENVSVDATYSSAEQKLDLNVWLTANITELENATLPILPDAVPPELKEIFKLYLNTTYCRLNTFTIMFNYTYGIAEFQADWTLQGDFKAQTNHGKRFFVNFLNATDPGMNDWQMRFFNATEIDISNFTATIGQGEDWMTFTFKGLEMYPIKDEIDFIRFKLHDWLNMTSDPEAPPKEFERLKIVLTGGSNGTHTILLHAPGTLPTPDITSLDYKTMVWENVTMSDLKDLLFKLAYQGIIDYLGKTYYVPIFTNSTVSYFNFNSNAKRLSFNVTGTTGTGFCNITIPRALIYATFEEWVVKIDGTILYPEDFNVTENDEYVFIYLNYTHSSHLIEIEGIWIITEFPPNMLPLILVIISLIAAIIAVKQRKKLDTLKTKYQSVIQTFANRLHELRT